MPKIEEKKSDKQVVTKTVEENYPFQTTHSDIICTLTDKVWEVLFVVHCRNSVDGKRWKQCTFPVKSYDKSLQKAVMTCQRSADIFFSTHRPEEIFTDEVNPGEILDVSV